VLHELGEFVNSPASYVEAPVIRQLHARFGITYVAEGRQGPEARSLATDVPASAGGLGPPVKRPKRDNHPLMGQISARRGSDSSADSAKPSGASPPPFWGSRSLEQRWADVGGGDASQAFEFEEWKLRGFSEVERDVWTSAGLRAGQARRAADLRDAGLTPSDLGVDLHGWKVIERLQQGEGAKAVARLLADVRAKEAG